MSDDPTNDADRLEAALERIAALAARRPDTAPAPLSAPSPGPGHAEEVARKMPTAVVLGCRDAAALQRLQPAFTTPFFRSYTSEDVAGIELGGALKKGGIVGDWPTLKANALFENRDVAPTLDMRGLFKGVLAEHMGLDHAMLEKTVFPDSDAARPVLGLV